MYVMSKRLDQVAKTYPVFEADQVLTPDALNGVFDYLDIQERLSRVELLGVGIVCGLEKKLLESEGAITISKGLGMTTDGDLVRVEGDERFEGFFLYRQGEDNDNRVVHRGDPIVAYQLVRKVEDDPRAKKLSDFKAETKAALSSFVVALFVETRISDPDLCSSTDCDNVGRVSTTELRVLLVDTKTASLLKEHVITTESTARALREVELVVPRVLIAGMDSQDDIEKAYRTQAAALRTSLDAAFDKLSAERAKRGVSVLDEVFATDPVGEWKAALDAAKASFEAFGSGVQIYFDFLKDVAETYDAFIDSLYNERTTCRPDYLDFPKHLLLGSLGDAAGRTTYRTGHYPSCAVSEQKGRLARPRFLGKKLSELMKNFSAPKPAAAGRIAITPCAGEAKSLEERAMPFYYRPEMHETWSFTLAERGMSDYVYSYHAEKYSAKGAAKAPLKAQIGKFGFFRIEGHLGQPVGTVVEELEKQIRDNNLPFVVRTVLLGRERAHVFRRPLREGLVRYNDMHRIHRLARHTLAEQVEKAAGFSADLEVLGNAEERPDTGLDAIAKSAVKRATTIKGPVLKQNADQASNKLRTTFTQYKQSATWKDDVQKTFEAAAELKSDLRDVAKAEVPTPIDTLVGSAHLQWLEWMDDIIKEKEDLALERSYFKNFLAENPSLEHQGGVCRGGTLVLAHDAQGRVVADFAVAYVCPEQDEVVEEPAPKPRPLAPVKPPWIRPDLILTLDKPLRSHIEKLKGDTEVLIDKRVSTQDQAVRMLDKAVTAASSGGAVKPSEVNEIRDEILDLKVEELKTKTRQAQAYRQKLFDPDLSASERAELEGQLQSTEMEVANVAGQAAKYVADKKIAVERGSDGVNAMKEIANSVGVLSSESATGALKSALDGIAVGDNAKLGGLIGAVKGSVKSKFAP